MEDFARRPPHERAEVFEETAARMGLGRAEIVEKDFWVCWVLEQVFGTHGLTTLTGHPQPAVFKGGTSLSKVFNLIDRFSEDIDLVLDRSVAALGVPDPGADGLSGKERKRRLEELGPASHAFIATQLLPFMMERCRTLTDATCQLDDADAATILLQYPRSLAPSGYDPAAYVKPVVRLECGVRGQPWPTIEGDVTSFAAAQFPALFTRPNTTVVALRPERTFWEKATILHEVAYRDQTVGGERQSRHYADLVALLRSPYGATSLRDDALLEEVATHKRRFFPRPRAHYELATRGTLRLVPSAEMRRQLAADYRKMTDMYFGEPEPWERIIETLAETERDFNATPEARTYSD